MISRATLNDFEDVERMALAFKEVSPYAKYAFDPNSIRNNIIVALTTPNFGIFLYKEDNKAVGMVAGLITKTMFSDAIIAGELMWWVDPGHRDKHVGIALKLAFENWAKENNCNLVSMVALDDENKEKIDLMYKKNGYRLTEYTYMKDI